MLRSVRVDCWDHPNGNPIVKSPEVDIPGDSPDVEPDVVVVPLATIADTFATWAIRRQLGHLLRFAAPVPRMRQ
ncbi:hypothetical protein [Nocardia crassostreae]|uniref:hypothetical protein n=1 Tax=Nocardia crassostreae TaxID=53428 RepID=UPI00082AA6B5|nr:hypothetical protein [Nocardia crassostreae]